LATLPDGSELPGFKTRVVKFCSIVAIVHIYYTIEILFVSC